MKKNQQQMIYAELQSFVAHAAAILLVLKANLGTLHLHPPSLRRNQQRRSRSSHVIWDESCVTWPTSLEQIC